MKPCNCYVLQLHMTPLHYAIDCDRTDIVKILLEEGGVDVNAKDDVSWCMM